MNFTVNCGYFYFRFQSWERNSNKNWTFILSPTQTLHQRPRLRHPSLWELYSFPTSFPVMSLPGQNSASLLGVWVTAFQQIWGVCSHCFSNTLLLALPPPAGTWCHGAGPTRVSQVLAVLSLRNRHRQPPSSPTLSSDSLHPLLSSCSEFSVTVCFNFKFSIWLFKHFSLLIFSIWCYEPAIKFSLVLWPYL